MAAESRDTNGWLVLRRRVGETLLIGEELEITVRGVEAGAVRLAIRAPRETQVWRAELAGGRDPHPLRGHTPPLEPQRP